MCAHHRQHKHHRSSSNHRTRRHHHRYSRRHDHSFISPLAKYSLFFFNLIFWVIGGALVGLGAWSFLEENWENDLRKFKSFDDIIINVSLALIIVGMIIFCMSFAGCLGALRENLCFLKLYSLMLLLLFIGEIILSYVAFVYPSSVTYFLKESLSKDPIMKYRDDANLQNLIDVVQSSFQCCGISDKGYKDWSRNIYFNCSNLNPSRHRCSVPSSCCRNPRNIDSGLINMFCGLGAQNTSSVVEVNNSIFTRGCIEAITDFFQKNLNIVASVCLICSVVQLFAMFLARTLQGQITAQLNS